MFADLHLHSQHSDGRLDPASLVDCVADAGIELMALTDHDTTEGLRAGASRARERGIHFVAGIEMTTYDRGRVIHALGFGFDAADSALQDANAIVRNVWGANQRRWIASLAQERFDVNLDRDFPDHPVRLPTLIERLCLHGVDDGDPRRVHARFRSYFAALPPEAYERLPTPAQAAAIVRGGSGILLLAHPAPLLDAGLVEPLLQQCDGLEAVYPAYGREQQEQLRALAARHERLYSGGSDYHGYFETQYRNPGFVIPPVLLERFGLAERT